MGALEENMRRGLHLKKQYSKPVSNKTKNPS